MKFLEFKPESADKIEGFSWRIDEYLGLAPSPYGIGMVHEWKVTKCEKSTGKELSSGKKLTATTGNTVIDPETLEVDDNGFLVESVNTIQRINSNGERNFIVPVGAGSRKLGPEYNF